jgi:hypothetical protein
LIGEASVDSKICKLVIAPSFDSALFVALWTVSQRGIVDCNGVREPIPRSEVSEVIGRLSNVDWTQATWRVRAAPKDRAKCLAPQPHGQSMNVAILS